jgi:hypothetical protein
MPDLKTDPEVARLRPDHPKYAERVADYRQYDEERKFEGKLLTLQFHRIDAVQHSMKSLKLSREELGGHLRAISKDQDRIADAVKLATTYNTRPW